MIRVEIKMKAYWIRGALKSNKSILIGDRKGHTRKRAI